MADSAVKMRESRKKRILDNSEKRFEKINKSYKKNCKQGKLIQRI